MILSRWLEEEQYSVNFTFDLFGLSYEFAPFFSIILMILFINNVNKSSEDDWRRYI